MTSYNQPHEVRDQNKLDSMIETLNNGGTLPAVIVCGNQAFTGSHRIAAWEACGIEATVIEISDEDYIATLTKMGLDWETDEVNDYNDFCSALYEVTDNEEIKNAIEDQR
jgi:uncharacterized ParB-like nuclease family protein